MDLQQTQVLAQCLAWDPSLISSAIWELLLLQHYLLSPGSHHGASARDAHCGGKEVLPPTATSLHFNSTTHGGIRSAGGSLASGQENLKVLRAVVDLPDEGEDNRQFRHAAYRQFVAWQCGTLGPCQSGHPKLLCVGNP